MALNEGAVDWSVNWSIDRLVKRSVGRGGVGERLANGRLLWVPRGGRSPSSNPP